MYNFQLKADLAANEQKPINNGTGENAAAMGTSGPTPGSDSAPPKDQVPSPPTPTSSGKSEPLDQPASVLTKDEDDPEHRDKGRADLEGLKDLRFQLKQAQASQKELKLLLDMYKSAPKEQRDKVQVRRTSRHRIKICSPLADIEENINFFHFQIFPIQLLFK